MTNDTKTPNYMEKLKQYTFSKKIIVGLIVLTILLSNLREVDENIEYFKVKYFSKSELSGLELKNEALKLSRTLIEFVEERRINEPEWDFDQWDESVKKSSEYSIETKSIYYQEYYPDIDRLRKEFLKHDISDKTFDFLYKHPTNFLVIEEIAMNLVEMANELR